MTTSARTATRRTVRPSAAATRETILEAALTAFSTYGYEAVSTRSIAAAAGIEQGHLVYYFPTKEALWREVVASFNVDFVRLLDTQEPSERLEEPVALAREILPKLLRVFAANRSLARLMLQEFSMQSGRRDWLVAEYGRPAWRRLQPLFAALTADRSPSVSPRLLYFAFLGSALFFFGSSPEVAAITGPGVEGDAAVEAFIRLQMEGLLGPGG